MKVFGSVDFALSFGLLLFCFVTSGHHRLGHRGENKSTGERNKTGRNICPLKLMILEPYIANCPNARMPLYGGRAAHITSVLCIRASWGTCMVWYYTSFTVQAGPLEVCT